MRRSRVLAVTAAAVASLAGAGALGACANAEGPDLDFGSDASARRDGSPDGTLPRHDGGHDGGHDAGATDSGKRDVGVDSTFGFDSYVPPARDAAHDRGVPIAPPDTGVDAGFDAGFDAGHDAGFLVYFGPPGTPCAKAGTLQSQACGYCGKQTSQCIVSPDGGVHYDAGSHGLADAGDADEGPLPDGAADLVWSDFTACSAQIDGGCLPGTTMTVACGLCGTQMLTCEPDCEYAATNCAGEVDGGCIPGSSAFDIVGTCTPDAGHDAGGHHHHADAHEADAHDTDAHHDAHDTDAHDTDAHHDAHDTDAHRDAHDTDGSRADGEAPDGAARDAGVDAGPPDTGPVASPVIEGNEMVCGQNTCRYTTSPTCELPPSTLTISSMPGGKVSTVINLSQTQETARIAVTSGVTFDNNCPTTFANPVINTPYGFVTVKNSSATEIATVSAWTWQVPGTTAISTYVTAYATTPTTPAEFEACLPSVQVNNVCDDMTDPTSCKGSYGGLMKGQGDPVKIPAGGSVVIFVQDQRNYLSDIAPVELSIRTEAFH